MSNRDVDLAHLPRGQIALREFVSKISQVADTTERDFFEVKSDVDLTTKSGRAKLAKFILGAANRDPVKAARRFDGHALLILGIRDGELYGIPPFEAHEVQAEVHKFTGIPGPGWDFEHLATEDGRSAIVVMVMPPESDKQPWVCQAENSQEKMRDGDIFLRADGQTRQARGAEVEAILSRRAVAALPQVDLDVSMVGTVRRYRYDDQPVEDYISRVRAKLLDALPKPKPPATPVRHPAGDAAAATLAALLGQMSNTRDLGLAGMGMQREDRTEDEYRKQIDQWAEEVRATIPELIDQGVGHSLPGGRIVVRSNNGYLPEPEFDLHIEGDVEAIEKDDRPSFKKQLPTPPRRWGPRSTIPEHLLNLRIPDYGVSIPDLTRLGPSYGRVRFNNGGSVTLSVDFAELRPGRSYEAVDDDFVLIYRGADPPSELHGTWKATVKGHDQVYVGELTVPVDPEPLDVTAWLARSLTALDQRDRDN